MALIIENMFINTMYFDSIDLHDRLKKGGCMLQDFENVLNKTGQTPVAGLTACAPFPVFDEGSGNVDASLQVLRPGAKNENFYDLTMNQPYDEVRYILH
jgi:hypothetical protein